ncbi:MAG TPA: FecR domain-containing protein [Treponemataceae bacterium]|nr:FecR domain-containing protein [Treponemataceae bacterium]
MRKIIVCASILLFVLTSNFMALDGQVMSVSGKVEYQNKTGVWVPLQSGDAVVSGTMISTGFKSQASVKLGASILTIKPLTRMTLTQLVEKEDIVDTELYLEVGNVKAEVISLSNKKNGFTVKSPVATASVRGTIFEMGEALVITQGSVVFVTPVGQQRTGIAGQELQLSGGSITPPVAAFQDDMGTIQLSSTPATVVTSPILATMSAPKPATPKTTTAVAPPPPKTTTVKIVID